MATTYDELLQRARTLRESGVRGRYAPSPSGPQHPGNLRTALVAWLQARLAGGAFILRMEDLDRPRVRVGSAQQILADLQWLGLDWDEGPDIGGPFAPYEQSVREACYQEALRRLQRRGRVFPCFCSRKDVQRAASAPHGGGGAIYPGNCRRLDASVVETRRVATGRQPSWRFLAVGEEVEFKDRISGPFSQNLAREVGDFVVRRSDGLFAYQLAVVVDDALMGVTDVVRGADLLDSTPRQIALFHELGLPVPRFWHLPLMRDESGRRMAKRQGAVSLDALRATGQTREQVVGRLAASLGLVPLGSELSAAELLETLDEDRFRHALRNAPREAVPP